MNDASNVCNTDNLNSSIGQAQPVEQPAKRGRGRPKGSLDKSERKKRSFSGEKIKSPPRKLTLKQERFIQGYIAHGNASKAVRDAYPDVKREGTSVRNVASENLAKPHIRARIMEILDREGLTPDLCAQELKKLVQDGENSEKNKAIRTALEVMGAIGAGSTAVQVNIAVPSSLEAIRKSLEDRAKEAEVLIEPSNLSAES